MGYREVEVGVDHSLARTFDAGQKKLLLGDDLVTG